MVDVLIVDDELLVRDALRAIVPWEDLGFRIAAEAHNGAEALRALEACGAQILITDIRMPVMDGLELIRAVRRDYPGVQIAVLSAYDEFHMVSSAFKLGASEYFLKAELQPDNVAEVLRKLGERIERNAMERRQREEREREAADSRAKAQALEHTLSANREALQERLLLGALTGGAAEGFDRQARELGLRLRQGAVRVMALAVSPAAPYGAAEGAGQAAERAALPGALRQVLDGRRQGDLVAVSPGGYAVAVSFEGAVASGRATGEMHQLFFELQEAARGACHALLSGGLSEAGGLEALPALHRQAVLACGYSFVAGRGRLIDCATLPAGPFAPFDGREAADCLKKALGGMDMEEPSGLAAALAVPREAVSPGRIAEIRDLFAQYRAALAEYAGRHGLADAMSAALGRYDGWLKDYGCLEELNAWLESCLSRLAETAGEPRRVVRLMKKYILKNYSRDISLAALSQELGASAGYLSRVFARESGCTFVEYLSRVRIEEAQRLLAETNLKMYEISERVGLANPEYFSRLFKKIVGKSPKDYMK
jgi:two-component system response regulator YesN